MKHTQTIQHTAQDLRPVLYITKNPPSRKSVKINQRRSEETP